MQTALCKRLGIRLPIVQAPMAGVSTPAMAAAVGGAGGLGSIAVGHLDAARAAAQIEAARALAAGPFNVNLFCHAPARADTDREAAWLRHLRPGFDDFGREPPTRLREIYASFVEDEAMLDMLTSLRPEVVSFHFGLPDRRRIEALRAAGIVLMACVTDLDEAARAEAAGIDVLIAQGFEAGGHRGVFDPGRDRQLGTLALVRMLAVRTSRPLIAAGGIMDGAGIAAALALGAGAAQLGTAFVGCPESSAGEGYRRLLAGAPAQDTQVTAAISGRPARGLRNAFMRRFDVPGAPPPPDYPRAYDAGKALHAAATAQGSDDYAATWAGQAAPLSRALPAADLVAALAGELRIALDRIALSGTAQD